MTSPRGNHAFVQGAETAGECACGRNEFSPLHTNRAVLDKPECGLCLCGRCNLPEEPGPITVVAFVEALTGVTLGEWQRNILNLFFEVKP